MCNGVRPRSAHVAERRVLPDPALLTDHHTETVQLGRQALVELDGVIEGIGDLSEKSPFWTAFNTVSSLDASSVVSCSTTAAIGCSREEYPGTLFPFGGNCRKSKLGYVRT